MDSKGLVNCDSEARRAIRLFSWDTCTIDSTTTAPSRLYS